MLPSPLHKKRMPRISLVALFVLGLIHQLKIISDSHKRYLLKLQLPSQELTQPSDFASVLRAQVPFTEQPTSNVTKVVLFPYIRQDTGTGYTSGWPGVYNTESKQIELDGIRESPYLELTMDVHETNGPVVWMGDTASIPGMDTTAFCEQFGKLIQETQMDRKCQGRNDWTWPVRIMDWTDIHSHTRCLNIEFFMGQSNVEYSKRGRVVGREWDPKAKWIKSGERKSFFSLEGRPYREIPLTVRTDTVEAMEHVLQTRYEGRQLYDRIERSLNRTYDIACLWPLPNSNQTTEVGSIQEANLRFRVSQLVHDIGEKHNLNYYVGLAGRATQYGRWGIMLEYIEMLFRSKIVVVVNRDHWEDHYRLMEALVSGALVFTDKWVVLPSGLEDGKSIVEFNGSQDLERKIQYYLSHPDLRMRIAAEGRWVAMTLHRTWHRMEQITFKEIKTRCDPDDRKCIYRVHVDDRIPTNCTEKQDDFGITLECLSSTLR